MNKGSFFISIGLKLMGIVSLILGISLGGLTLLSTWFFSNDIERTIRANTLDRVELLSDKIGSELTNDINTGSLIAATMDGGFTYAGTSSTGTSAGASNGSGASSVSVSVTENLLAKNESLKGIWIIGMEETLPVVNNRAGEMGDEGNKAIAALGNRVTTVFAGETVVANASPEFGEPVLAIAFPYAMKSETEADTIVILAVSMDTFFKALSTRELYTNYLVDSSGTLLVHPDTALTLARPSWANEEIVGDSMKGEVKLKQMQFTSGDGKQYIGSYQRFFNDSLAIVSAIPTTDALANVFVLQKRNMIITAMILCLSLFVLFFFSKSLTSPISRLMQGAVAIGKGDFSVQIPPTTRDEIGRLSATFNEMTLGLAERDKIKNAFGKFVNKEVAERAMRGDIALGGESRSAAIFFSDIRSFTSISEKLSPHEVVEFLNDYMTRMVACVDKTNGVVDKFIGDAIMAIWGVPYSHGNDTENAINAAIMMRAALAEFNKGRGGDRTPIIRIGSGINTGEVIAGQIGSMERMEYTCIGDAVNLASRIESLNKIFKTDILISEHSYSLVKNIFRVEPMKKIRVKGKEEPQQIYAVLGRLDSRGGFTSIDDLRSYLGLEAISLDSVDPDAQEEKYEIIEGV